MTGTWILMLVYSLGYGPRPTAQFQEFTTKERCEAAKTVVISAWTAERQANMLLVTTCIQK